MTDDNIQKAARTARSAIADLVEAARDEKRVDGQGVRYWAEVAAHSIARNDTLISQLKEKEKIAAEQEQRITSLQNEVLNQVYVGTQDGLEAELEKARHDAAMWERKTFEREGVIRQHELNIGGLRTEIDRQSTIIQEREAELRDVKARYKEDEEVYERTREEIKALKEKTWALIRHAEINECPHDETHRGGSLWTICDRCGRRWADDQGGFKPYEEPEEIKAARQAIGA